MDSQSIDKLSTDNPQDVELIKDVKRATRRSRIKAELFETEKAYIGHLQLVHKYFDFPLRFNCLIVERTHAHIFSNIEQIHEVNRHLLTHMEQGTIGSAFLYLAPFLKLYSTYANNHEFALETLQECVEKDTKFGEFLHTQEATPDVGGLKLNALLITPVQRIPRYKLLLEDLLHSTPPCHHDYADIKEAVAKISDLATYINEQIRHHSHFHKMLAIQRSLVGPAPRILAPGRGFIKQGRLKKISRRRGKRLQDRMFYLFSDMLLYAKPRPSDESMYTCCAVYPLTRCVIQRLFAGYTNDIASNGIVFKVTCKEESVHVYSPHHATGHAWFNAILHAIIEINGHNGDMGVVQTSSRRRGGSGEPGQELADVKKPKLERLDPAGSPCIQPIRQQLMTLRQACRSPRQQCHTRYVHTAGCLAQSPFVSPHKRKQRLIGQIRSVQQPITCGLDNPGVNLNESTENWKSSIHGSLESLESDHLLENKFKKNTVTDTIADPSFGDDSDDELDASYDSGESEIESLVETNSDISSRSSLANSSIGKENSRHHVKCANTHEYIAQENATCLNTHRSSTKKAALSESYDGNLRQELKEKYLIKGDESKTSFIEDSVSSNEYTENHGNCTQPTQDSFVLVDEGLSYNNLDVSVDMFADSSHCDRRVVNSGDGKTGAKLVNCTAVHLDKHDHRSTLSRVTQTMQNSVDHLRSVKRDHCSLQ